jgi:hypothetical protein
MLDGRVPQMAAVAGASPSAIVRGLPDPAWNHE